MRGFAHRLIPKKGLDELVVRPKVLAQLRSIVQLEKSRAVLFGLWGFSDDRQSAQGTSCLFWARRGAGAMKAAEAIGFEVAKPVKVVDIVRLLSNKDSSKSTTGGAPGGHTVGGKSEGEVVILNVFTEARLMDAVLVLEGFEFKLGDRKGGGGGGDDNMHKMRMLLHEMARFPGIVVLMMSSKEGIDYFVDHLDPELVATLKFFVEFKVIPC